MAIVDTIESIKTNLANAYNVAEGLGAEIPENRNMENLPPALASIPTGGGGASDYVRPSDWLEIPEMDGTIDEIYMLNGVGRNCLNQVKLNMTHPQGTIITIDWGDGIVEQHTSGAITHIYNHEEIPLSTWTEHNKSKQVLIHIYGERGILTTFNAIASGFKVKNADGKEVSLNGTTTDYYQINVDTEDCVFTGLSATNNIASRQLEIFDAKGISAGESGTFVLFENCNALRYISTNMLSINDMAGGFENCSSLKKIFNIDISKSTRTTDMFNSCYSLTEVQALNTKNSTNMNSMFYGCYSLTTLSPFNTSLVTSMSSMFGQCLSLRKILLDTSNVTSISSAFSRCVALEKIELYNLNPNYTSAITVDINYSTFLTKQALVDFFNSVAVNINGYSRTLRLGTTLQGYLADVYVKDSGQLYTIILPTSDTEIDATKTYYTYDEKTDTYTEVVPDFASYTIYHELKTATWNRYDICESTDDGAMLALDFATNVKGYTIT